MTTADLEDAAADFEPDRNDCGQPLPGTAARTTGRRRDGRRAPGGARVRRPPARPFGVAGAGSEADPGGPSGAPLPGRDQRKNDPTATTVSGTITAQRHWSYDCRRLSNS